jgi:hypothetical protein
MIDLKKFNETFYNPLLSYTGILQVVKEDQDIPETDETGTEILKTPRIGYKAISPYIPETGMPCQEVENVACTDPNFDYDILITNVKQPEFVYSFTLYGQKNDVMNETYIGKARDWFDTPELSQEILEAIGVVVVDVMEIQPRGTGFLDFDREERIGFDVRFRTIEKTATKISTFEEIVNNGTFKN